MAVGQEVPLEDAGRKGALTGRRTNSNSDLFASKHSHPTRRATNNGKVRDLLGQKRRTPATQVGLLRRWRFVLPPMVTELQVAEF